jgi:hypothetical protein
VTALLGVLLGTAAVVGYLRNALSPTMRAVHAAVGLILLIPVDAFEGAGWLNAVAFAVGAVLVLYEFYGRVALKRAA